MVWVVWCLNGGGIDQQRHARQPSHSSDCNSLYSPLLQVLSAINSWRAMLPASEVVAQKAQGQEVAHAAQLMGLRVNKKERRSEEEVIQMRVSTVWWERCTAPGWPGQAVHWWQGGSDGGVVVASRGAHCLSPWPRHPCSSR